MSFIADVSIDMPLMAPTHEAVPSAEATLADFHHVNDEHGQDRFRLFLWTTGCSFDALESAMEADETLASYAAITDSGDRRLYRVYSAPHTRDGFTFASFLREQGVALFEVTRDREALHFRGQFPSRAVLQALQREVERADGWFRLDAVYSEASAIGGVGRLTERQAEVLAVAANRGYFETPAEVTLSEIAEDRAVTPQALSSHLRSAVRKLVYDAVEGVGAPRSEP